MSPRTLADGPLALFLATLPSLVLVALWLGRARVDWNIILPGVAWRLFLVLYTAPFITQRRPRRTH
ncbi:MAG TPA: hypothetical protein VFD73_23735 [Gemmatimonadales bacterium]|nr:hypothetical protein [Gemmatimonadales bacterium]